MGKQIPKQIDFVKARETVGNKTHIYGNSLKGFSSYNHHVVHDTNTGTVIDEEVFKNNDGGTLCIADILMLINQLRPSVRERTRKTRKWNQKVDRIRYENKPLEVVDMIEVTANGMIHVLGRNHLLPDGTWYHHIAHKPNGEIAYKDSFKYYKAFAGLTHTARRKEKNFKARLEGYNKLVKGYKDENTQDIEARANSVDLFTAGLYEVTQALKAEGIAPELIKTGKRDLYIGADSTEIWPQYPYYRGGLDQETNLKLKAERLGANALVHIQHDFVDTKEKCWEIAGIPVKYKQKSKKRQK